MRLDPGTRWLALLTTIASLHVAPPARGATPNTEGLDDAKALFNEGAAAYKAGRFDEAVEHFLAADRIAPSSALSYNVARAYEKLNEEARALEYYRHYLRRGPAAQNAEEVRERIVQLEAILMARGVQQLTVLSQPSGATLRMDGRLVGATPWTGELAPGKHRVVVSKPGFTEESRVIELPLARATEVELALTEQPADTTPVSGAASVTPPPGAGEESDSRSSGMVRAGPWITMGAGGAALLGAGAFELLRRSAESDAESASQAEYREPYERMGRHQTTARVLAGVGGALVVAGGVWALLARGEEEEANETARVGCTMSSCMGRVTVRF